MQKSFFDEKLIEKVTAAGWQQIDAGATRRKDLNELCIVFMKAQPLADRIDLSAKEFAEKPEISTIFGSPKDSVMEIFESEGGVCYDFLSTLSSGSSLCDDYLSITSSFVDSLRLCSNHKLCIKADVCWTGNPALFVTLDYPFDRLKISGVEIRLRRLGRSQNLERVHPHKFRRTMATRAIDKGMPVEQVQKILGHSQIDTTMKYAMVNQTNVKTAHRKFIA